MSYASIRDDANKIAKKFFKKLPELLQDCRAKDQYLAVKIRKSAEKIGKTFSKIMTPRKEKDDRPPRSGRGEKRGDFRGQKQKYTLNPDGTLSPEK